MFSCDRCRQDKQKCTPTNRVWPTKCDRCVKRGLNCSKSERKRKRGAGAGPVGVTSIVATTINTNSELQEVSVDTQRLGNLAYYRRTLRMGLDKLKILEEELEALFPQGHQEPCRFMSESLEAGLQTHYKNLDLVIAGEADKLYRTISCNRAQNMKELLEDLAFSDEIRCVLCHDNDRDDFLKIDDDTPLWASLQLLASASHTCRRHYLSDDRKIGENIANFFSYYDSVHEQFYKTLELYDLEHDRPSIARETPIFVSDDVIFHAVKARYEGGFFEWLWYLLDSDCLGRTWFHQILDLTPRASARVLWQARLNELKLNIQKSDDTKIYIRDTDVLGRAVLHIACQKGYSSIAEVLLEKGAEPMQSAARGLLPLHFAAASGSLEICKTLVSRIRHDELDTMDDFGKRPIDYAIANRYSRVACFLSSVSRPRLYTHPPHNPPPLIKAVWEGDLPTVRQLLSHRADINVSLSCPEKYPRCTNPLIEALRSKCIRKVEITADLLLSKRADIDAQLYGGETALHIFASKGRSLIVEYLVKRNAKIDMRDDGGRTALMCACKHFHGEEVVEVFLEMTTDLDLLEMTDFWGRTAVDYAREAGHDTVVELLERTIADRQSRRTRSPTPCSRFPSALVALPTDEAIDLRTMSDNSMPDGDL
ncbi:ankyrin [Lentithecium fluviatile CBS 122367]|uniref:Ankyrin n=1 Tax=Lentithecium fluviatile CBS 122367 TaxID=1168545 RepID=A0A6G1JER5_9PLEO|nr:ankyrin [Lentithecium fluviatile CBS 122367]